MPRRPVQAAALLWTAASFADAPAPPPPPPPNVLLIAVDDLNDWTGGLRGHPQARTPHLDALAARGVLFTNAHTAAPSCNPSRVALMTGIPPHRSGIYHNQQAWRTVLRDAVTLPQLFRAGGYVALGGGKVYHDDYPDPTSWDDYFPSQLRAKPKDPQHPGRPVNGFEDGGQFDWGALPVAEEEMGDAKVAGWIVEQLTRQHDRPFFLAWGIYRPHLPWYVPEKYFAQFPLDEVRLPEVVPDDLADVPPAGRKLAEPEGDHREVLERGQWKQAVRAYLASIAFSDAMLGRVIEALERSPHARNTVVVLWSDHGCHLGQKQHWRKSTLWEESTRVPLVVVAPAGTPGLPAGTPAGARSAQPVSLLDVYPTLAELGGFAAPAEPRLGGRSLVPLLRDPAATAERAVLITNGPGNHAVRDLRWRYIRYADGGEELYDHAVDPLEATNLAGRAEQAPTKARLAQVLPAEEAPEAPSEPPRLRRLHGRSAPRDPD
jgi:arylsulfatase A-like enzyme